MDATHTPSAARRRGPLARIDEWFERRRLRAIEAYLATSQNASELEARMRDLDRTEPRPYF